MEIKDIRKAFITVHNGQGNYREIDVEDLTKYKMESEQMIIPEEACTIVNAASAAGQNICAVGTSVLRAMETASGTQRHLKAFDGWTSKFIFPPLRLQRPQCSGDELPHVEVHPADDDRSLRGLRRDHARLLHRYQGEVPLRCLR